MRMERLNVLVCGDERVGKSSLISTYVSQHFSPSPPPTMTDVNIAAEVSMTAQLCTNLICLEENLTTSPPSTSIQSPDCIILVYDLERRDTFDRLSTHWLPLIEETCQSLGKATPVIVVCNKVDLRVDSAELRASHAELASQVSPMMQRFRMVQCVVECSPKLLQNVTGVFQQAQSAVMFPLAPLKDTAADQLQPKLYKALKRIFRMLDEDFDGLLRDEEVMEMQLQVFKTSLSKEDLRVLKALVTKKRNESESAKGSGAGHSQGQGIQRGSAGGLLVGSSPDRRFKLEGFVALIATFIERNALVSPWKILRHYGYDDMLDLTIPEAWQTAPKQCHDQASELCEAVRVFLASTWKQFCKDETLGLSPSDQEEIFSVLPEEMAAPPWWRVNSEKLFASAASRPIVRDEMACLRCSEWLANWQMVASISPAVAKTCLFQLGYRGHPSSAISLYQVGLKGSQYNRMIQPRRVWTACVLAKGGRGMIGLGLGALVEAGAGSGTAASAPQSVAVCVKVPQRVKGGGEAEACDCAIVLTAVPSKAAKANAIMKHQRCELAIIVTNFNDEESVRYALE
ncbi:unnamed protein product, partial [Chrysoparadoxa australica]